MISTHIIVSKNFSFLYLKI